MELLVLDQGRRDTSRKQIICLRLRLGFGQRGLRLALGLFLHRVRLARRLRHVLIRLHDRLGELVFLLLGGLLRLDFLVERALQRQGQMHLAHAERHQRQMAAVEFRGEDGNDVLDHLRAFGRGDFLPRVLGGDHRHLRTRVLPHHPGFHHADRRAAPIQVKLRGFRFLDLILDDDIQVDLLTLVALHLDRIVAGHAFFGALHHCIRLDRDRVFLDRLRQGIDEGPARIERAGGHVVVGLVEHDANEARVDAPPGGKGEHQQDHRDEGGQEDRADAERRTGRTIWESCHARIGNFWRVPPEG